MITVYPKRDWGTAKGVVKQREPMKSQRGKAERESLTEPVGYGNILLAISCNKPQK